MPPDPPLVERFAVELDALIARESRVGIAVSGGPDSVALLLLTAAARPGRIEAATVDHRLRDGSAEEGAMAGRVCASLGVPHEILVAEWPVRPETAVQERAREERYRLLADWAARRRLDAVATAHHLDDQAETLLMRLARGAGVRGLAGMRPVSRLPGSEILLVRPLLGWRRSELEQVCTAAAVDPARDPSNEDEQFERIRVRRGLRGADWLNPQSLASSAANLGQAEAAIEWATQQEWAQAVTNGGAEIIYRPTDAPPEIRRRIVARAVARLATEGQGSELRGRELARLLLVLGSSGTATLRGVRCSGGPEWRFAPARSRTR
jgi:tRNA(Ile)-lysidine synthase